MVFSSDNLPYSLNTGIMNLEPKNLVSSVRNSIENKFDYFITNIFDQNNNCEHKMEELIKLQNDKNNNLRRIIANIQLEINFEENKEKDLKKKIKK